MTTTTTGVLVPVAEPLFTVAERHALAGFLSAYSGLTRDAYTLDLAIGERLEGPDFLRAGGQRLDRHGAGRTVHRIAKRAGIAKPISPHTLRHAFITATRDAGVPLRNVQEAASHADPHTTIRYDNFQDRSTGTPPYRRALSSPVPSARNNSRRAGHPTRRPIIAPTRRSATSPRRSRRTQPEEQGFASRPRPGYRACR